MSELRKRTVITAGQQKEVDSEEKKGTENIEDLPTYLEIAKFVLVGLSFGLVIMVAMHGTRYIGLWLDGKAFQLS